MWKSIIGRSEPHNEITPKVIVKNVSGILNQHGIGTDRVWTGEVLERSAASVIFNASGEKPYIKITNGDLARHEPENFVAQLGDISIKLQKAGLIRESGSLPGADGVGLPGAEEFRKTMQQDSYKISIPSVIRSGNVNYGIEQGNIAVTITLDETNLKTIHTKLKQIYLEKEKELRAEYGIEEAARGFGVRAA